jgi:hypothetical protein
MNPVHEQYCKRPTYNTLEELLGLLARLAPPDREELLAWPSINVISPTYERPRAGRETTKEPLLAPLNHSALAEKCRRLVAVVSEEFLVRSIVLDALTWAFFYCDESRGPRWIAHHERVINWANQEIIRESDEQRLRTLQKIRASSQDALDHLTTQIDEAKRRSEAFCEAVVSELIRASECADVISRE